MVWLHPGTPQRQLLTSPRPPTSYSPLLPAPDLPSHGSMSASCCRLHVLMVNLPGKAEKMCFSPKPQGYLPALQRLCWGSCPASNQSVTLVNMRVGRSQSWSWPIFGAMGGIRTFRSRDREWGKRGSQGRVGVLLAKRVKKVWGRDSSGCCH